ncbi:ABC transporter substrate-binding protein [Pendulispora albinea]|uniref:ABC transporter substrate-binding protein n=1 Tax=Pendulispora albinea TaxID=2741071 RepID=A0ABZ2LL50_9BACT
MGVVSACSLVVDSSKDQCDSDAQCVAKGQGFASTVCTNHMCLPKKAPVGKCEGSLKVKGIMTLTGPTSEVGVPYALGIKDYFNEINANGGIKGAAQGNADGCKIEYEEKNDEYVPANAVGFWEAWAKDSSWKDVVQVMTWGSDTTIQLAPKATEHRKPTISASYSGILASPLPANAKANVPEVGSNFNESSLSQEFKSEGYPYSFFAGTDYSTSIRTAMFHAKSLGAKRVGFFYCFNAAYCRGPIPAGRSYARDPAININIGRDLETPLTSDEATYDSIVYDYFKKELDYKKTHPDYDPVDWIWVGNTQRTAAFIAKSAEKAYQALRTYNPPMAAQVQIMINVYGFDEGLYPQCRGACVGNVHGVLPFLAYGDRSRGSSEMQKVVDLHNKWRAAEGDGDAGAGINTKSAKYVQGYISAMMFRLAVERLVGEGKVVTAEALKNAYESFSPSGMNTSGLSAALTFSPQDHRPQSSVAIYKIDSDGNLVFEADRNIARQDEWRGW